jgi:hypothetical protein
MQIGASTKQQQMFVMLVQQSIVNFKPLKFVEKILKIFKVPFSEKKVLNCL